MFRAFHRRCSPERVNFWNSRVHMSIELLERPVWNEEVVSKFAFYGLYGFNSVPKYYSGYNKIYAFLLRFTYLCIHNYFFIFSVPVDHTFFLANFCTVSLASSSLVGVLPKQHPAGGAPTGSSSGSGITGNTLSDQCNILIINPKYDNKLWMKFRMWYFKGGFYSEGTD